MTAAPPPGVGEALADGDLHTWEAAHRAPFHVMRQQFAVIVAPDGVQSLGFAAPLTTCGES